MKKRKILYNEINEENYAPIFWTKSRLIIIGLFLLLIGFLANFSIEDRINKTLQNLLGTNAACPILFERAELGFFLPKIIVRKPIISGACFGQFNNQLAMKDLKIFLHSPSFYPVGLRLHIEAISNKTKINLFPVISLFSNSIKIENTIIDSQFFAPMTKNNQSPISGNFSVEGFFEFKSGSIVDGEIDIASKNFSVPSQNIQGFELTKMNLKEFRISAKFVDSTDINVEKIQIGTNTSPVEMNLKGKIKVSAGDFLGSKLILDGKLRLSPVTLTTFAFLKLFLPPDNTSGNYLMKLNGTLRSPGAPKLL